jgi:hypothetical protein
MACLIIQKFHRCSWKNMYYQAIMFVAGVLLLHRRQCRPVLPTVTRRNPCWYFAAQKPVAFLLLGYCWAGSVCTARLHTQLDRALEGKTVRIEGRIDEWNSTCRGRHSVLCCHSAD